MKKLMPELHVRNNMWEFDCNYFIAIICQKCFLFNKKRGDCNARQIHEFESLLDNLNV